MFLTIDGLQTLLTVTALVVCHSSKNEQQHLNEANVSEARSLMSGNLHRFKQLELEAAED